MSDWSLEVQKSVDRSREIREQLQKELLLRVPAQKSKIDKMSNEDLMKFLLHAYNGGNIFDGTIEVWKDLFEYTKAEMMKRLTESPYA